MNKSHKYLLLTLCPGTVVAETAFLVVAEWPSWRIVEAFEQKHGVYETTHKGFAGASLAGDKLIVTTEAEVIQFGLAPISMRKVTTQPFLNDLHHVAPTQGGFVVVNTGLDCLELFDRQWNHRSTISLIPFFNRNMSYLARLMKHSVIKSRTRMQRGSLYGHLNHRIPFPNVLKFFSPMGIRQSGRDLRYYDLRPHFLHPNHVTVYGDECWVTLLRPGIVIRIPDGQILASDLGRPHDGVIIDDEYLLTDCKNSQVIIFNMKGNVPGDTRLIANVIPPDGKGFVRGIVAVDDKIFVGLTALRGRAQFPRGRIAVLDRLTGKIRDSWIIPEKFGSSVFSILDVTQFFS